MLAIEYSSAQNLIMAETSNLAQNWSEEERHNLYVAREKVLIALHDGESLDFSNRIGVIATLSLMSEGYLELSAEDPSKVNLTDIGQRFANGTVALSHG
jgi:hypothetical protein